MRNRARAQRIWRYAFTNMVHYVIYCLFSLCVANNVLAELLQFCWRLVAFCFGIAALPNAISAWSQSHCQGYCRLVHQHWVVVPSLTLLTFIADTSIILDGPFLSESYMLYDSVARRSAAEVHIGGRSIEIYCAILMASGALRARLPFSSLSRRCSALTCLPASWVLADRPCNSIACGTWQDLFAVASVCIADR